MHTTAFKSWAAGLACALACSAAAAAAAKPNIVMIMTDDLDTSVWSTALSLGYMPQTQTHLIAKGTTFNNTFAALSTCCPSRSTFFTGQYPHNHGVIRNTGPQGGFASFTTDDNTLAVWLNSAGYRTGLIGKYLNGYGAASSGTYIPPGWEHWQALGTSAMFDYQVSNNGTLVSYGSAPSDYQTDVLAGFAQAFIRLNDPRPFFLALTPTAPHYETGAGGEDDGRSVRPAPRHADTPAVVPIPPESLGAFNESNLGDKPSWMRKLPPADAQAMRDGYSSKVAAMRALDDLVGRVITALRDVNAEDQTLIIFTSDNGYQYGTHRRTAKTDLYEESIRLPMVIRAPGQASARISDDWAMNTDWAATIVDYAAAAPGRTLDGRSLRPQIEGSASGTGRRSALVELPSDNRRTLDQRPFLMIRSKDPALTQDPTGHKVMVYAQTYDHTGTELLGEELYDLDEDPNQLVSLHKSTAQKRIDQKAALSVRLMQLKSCAGDGCRALESQ
jgi:N-acetylglucosamine-6-sulfatase